MTSNRVKRVLACALAVVMMVMCWFPTYAKAVVLEGAAILTLDLFINILIIAMLGSEMDGAFRGAAAADDMKPKDWLSLQINKYTNGEGLHEPGLLNMFQAGVKYWQDGTIVIGEQMADWITDFQNWLWGDTEDTNSPMIKDFAEYIDSDVLEYNGVRVAPISLGTTNNNNNGFYNTLPLYYMYASVAHWVFVSNNDKLYMGRYGNNTMFIINFDDNNLRYGSVTQSEVGYQGLNLLTIRPNQVAFNSTSSSFSGPLWDALPESDILPSGTFDIDDFTNEGRSKGDPMALSLAMGSGLNPGVAIGLPDSVMVGSDGQSVPADATVDISDYVSAVADAAAGVYYPTMPVAIPGEGVVDVPVAIPSDVAVPVDGVDDVGVDDVTGEAAGDVAGEASDDVTGTGDYTVALSDFFPFCIPFDLLAMLKKFQASAEAPRVDVPFNIQGNITTFTVDLSPWDPVARVLRTMEKIAFAIGLAWATKNLIQGGS